MSPRRRNHRIRRIGRRVSNKTAIVEDDGCGETPPKIARFKSASHWKEEQSRISSEVTSAFFHETLVTFEGEHCLAREIVWGAVNLCLIDWGQQVKGQFRDNAFHRKILLDMNQVVVLYAKQSLTPPGFVTDAYSMLFVMEYDTPVHSNSGMFADCHKQAKKAYEARLAKDYILCETELKLLCLMRAWFLTYYDRSSATYEKCRNVLTTLGHHPGGATVLLELMWSEHCSHRNLMHTALVENQADLRSLQNQIPTTGLAGQMHSMPPTWIKVNAQRLYVEFS
jgi:hypothetical protein